MTTSPHLAVVYLARKVEGIEPVKRFVDSYVAHEAGAAHELIVVFKGFVEGDAELVKAKRVLGVVPFHSINIDDTGTDITAYLHAAKVIEHHIVCFLNTFSEIEDEGWLHKLLSQLQRDDVGLVGATGSYESLSSSMELLSKVIWLCFAKEIPFDQELTNHYKWLIRSQYPQWFEKAGDRSLFRRVKGAVLSWNEYRLYDAEYDVRWKTLIQPDGPIAWAPLFPEFPNPHLRTNCFMLERRRLLDFNFPKVVDKMEGCAFESGHNSLTARIRKAGLSVLVVGKDSVGYDLNEWPQSYTFRLGDQRNILVSDNHVRNFKKYSPEERASHVLITWGDYISQQSAHFPTLRKKFERAKKPL